MSSASTPLPLVDHTLELLGVSESFIAPFSATVSHHGKELETVCKTIAEMEKLLSALESEITCLSTQKTLLERQLCVLLEENDKIDREFLAVDRAFQTLSSNIGSYGLMSRIRRVAEDADKVKKSSRVVQIEGPHYYVVHVSGPTDGLPGLTPTAHRHCQFIFHKYQVKYYSCPHSTLLIC